MGSGEGMKRLERNRNDKNFFCWGIRERINEAGRLVMSIIFRLLEGIPRRSRI